MVPPGPKGICVMARPLAAVPVIPRSANTPANNPKDLLLRSHWKSGRLGRYISHRCVVQWLRPPADDIPNTVTGFAHRISVGGSTGPSVSLGRIRRSPGFLLWRLNYQIPEQLLNVLVHDERCRAAHDDDHARPVLMRVKHAFIGLAPAVRMDGPGFPLAVLAGIQVSAGGGS